ncbi:MAG: hypothetical protein P1P86_02775 [Bacteroidales bacterium]|nr:hypothetical protein [Bacteroidales bacterium]
MINVKEATEKAKEHLLSFFPDAEQVQLEEVELSPDKAHWLITLSYEGISSSVASSLLVGKSLLYKLFKLDADNGEVISMKIRDVRS